MTKRAPQLGRATVSSFPPMAAFDAAFLDNFTRTSETCVQACLAWQHEFLRFMTSRLQRDSEVGQALASSRTLDEAAALQREWIQSTAQDYFDEANRLTQLAAKAAPAWMTPFAAEVPTAAKESEPHTAE